VSTKKKITNANVEGGGVTDEKEDVCKGARELNPQDETPKKNREGGKQEERKKTGRSR